MVARIDTGSDSPQTTPYTFDPVESARADRFGIVAGAIVVHRAWHEAGRPRTDDIPTRFAEWGRTVRPMVQWLESSGIAADAGIGTLGDPAAAMLSGNSNADPGTEAKATLLYGLEENFGDEPFAPGDIAKNLKDWATSSHPGRYAIYEGLTGLSPRLLRTEATSQGVTPILRDLRDCPVMGLKLVEVQQFGRDARRGSLWRVVPA